MPYNLQIRQKVIQYIEGGGRISRAAKIFKVSRASIYRWLDRKNLESLVVKRRQRKLNWSELEKDVRENPDARLIDRANKFGVKIPAIY